MLRKKRVTISEQAQAAIAAGMPVDQALAEHGTPAPAADASASTEPATPAPAAIDPPEGTVVPAAEEPVVDVDATSQPAADATDDEPAPVDAVTSLLDRLQTAQNTIATQEADITQLNASMEALQTVQKSLMGIAAAATNRMQIALGGAATDLSSLNAENLLAQYQSTLTTFETRLPVGGKAEVPVEDEDRDGKVVTLVSPAVARATQIRK